MTNKLTKREFLAFWIFFMFILQGCSKFWCWPYCQDAEQERTSTKAIADHCQAVGDLGPDGGHIKAYNACMQEAGLK